MAALHQASQAVAYAHARGVVHRDLKPANVMVGAHGEVQVVDWGLCKLLGREETVAEQVVVERGREATRMGRVMGTPAYMAPEQARGDVDRTDARTDVYALGAMLGEVLTGVPPYSGATGAEVVARVLAGPPPAPSRLSRSASAMVDATDEGPSAVGTLGGVRESAALPLPDELVEACRLAMAREPANRYPSAAAFADDLQA